ncbi:MAG TPA: hypothetical protein VMB47_13615 [Candidatus Aquilonibacter sp.]|nr:hypothetical protein [Candidatus Aquilonibacter sp.]
MRSMLHKAAIAGSLAVLSLGVAMAADIPTGVVSDSVLANVDGTNAALGANVYAGDALSTNSGGTLRLRVGSGQLFLLASSDASMTQDHSRIDLLMRSGTAGFSATDTDPLEIDTPVGTVRPANDKHAYGQVTLIGPRQILITSYEGTLLLTRNGEERLIEAGKSYRVTLAADSANAPAPAPDPQSGQGAGAGGHKHQWIFDLAIAGGAGGLGYLAWHFLCESPSAPSNLTVTTQ